MGLTITMNITLMSSVQCQAVEVQQNLVINNRILGLLPHAFVLISWIAWCKLWLHVFLLPSLLCFKSVCHKHKLKPGYGSCTSNVSVQFSSVTQLCPTICDPTNRGTPGLPVHHQLLEFTQTHVHRVGDAIQPSHPLLSPTPTAPNPSQHQGLFQWVSSSHQVAKVLEFQL